MGQNKKRQRRSSGTSFLEISRIATRRMVAVLGYAGTALPLVPAYKAGIYSSSVAVPKPVCYAPAAMDILICADSAYLKGLVVTIESLLANAAEPCRLHLALDRFDDRTCELLRQHWAGHRSLAKLRIGSLDHVPAAYQGNCHFSRAAYGKVSLGPIAEHVENNLLVLDPDTIVHCDVTRLADIDLGDHLMGVVYEQPQTFNSGVVLVNLARWQEQGVEAALLASWADNPNVKNAEQDLLNREIRPEWLMRLDASWNIFSHAWQPGMRGIIHCVGGRKPWHGDYGKNPEVQRLFFEHLDRTFLASQREWAVVGSLKRRINKWRIRREQAA